MHRFFYKQHIAKNFFGFWKALLNDNFESWFLKPHNITDIVCRHHQHILSIRLIVRHRSNRIGKCKGSERSNNGIIQIQIKLISLRGESKYCVLIVASRSSSWTKTVGRSQTSHNTHIGNEKRLHWSNGCHGWTPGRNGKQSNNSRLTSYNMSMLI